MTGTIAADSADPIVQRLRSLAGKAPELKDAARVYEAVLPLLRDADLRVAPLSLTPEQVRETLENGVPILHDLALEMDTEALYEHMLRLATAVETLNREDRPRDKQPPDEAASPELLTPAGRIRLELEQNKLDIAALLPHIAAGRKEAVSSAAQDLGLDPDLVWTLAQSALKPALRAWCRNVMPLARDIVWNRDTCFVCGSVAVFGELRDNNQKKHLRCGTCGADWPVPRLQCMHCGNADHRTQHILYAENHRDTALLETCDQCRFYLKVISTFAPTPPDMLLIEDLATVRLDHIAQGRGYRRTVNP